MICLDARGHCTLESMRRSPESAVIAEFLGEHLHTDDERAAFERDVECLMEQFDQLRQAEDDERNA